MVYDMPIAPPKPCTYAGCNALTTKGSRCPAHPYERTRSATTESYKYLYNSARWKKSRLSFLMKHPLCVDCQKRNFIEPATVVDHIEPHKGNAGLFFNQRNWQSLCKRCHDRKTAREDGGFGN